MAYPSADPNANSAPVRDLPCREGLPFSRYQPRPPYPMDISEADVALDRAIGIGRDRTKATQSATAAGSSTTTPAQDTEAPVWRGKAFSFST
jgi:hypothetical protein